MRDWTGNKKTTFSTLGASSHSDHEREKNDYYATDPNTIDALFAVEEFSPFIWECACGEGHLSTRMAELDKAVWLSDIIDRGNNDVIDFLTTNKEWNGDIITNPPYKYAQEFLEKSMEVLDDNRKVAMFLKLTFLEGQKRKEMFKKYPPKKIYVFSKRQKCALNGDFANTGSSAVAYAWYVWEKGFTGKPQIEWI